jgi:hypothetical protein
LAQTGANGETLANRFDVSLKDCGAGKLSIEDCLAGKPWIKKRVARELLIVSCDVRSLWTAVDRGPVFP